MQAYYTHIYICVSPWKYGTQEHISTMDICEKTSNARAYGKRCNGIATNLINHNRTRINICMYVCMMHLYHVWNYLSPSRERTNNKRKERERKTLSPGWPDMISLASNTLCAYIRLRAIGIHTPRVGCEAYKCFFSFGSASCWCVAVTVNYQLFISWKWIQFQPYIYDQLPLYRTIWCGICAIVIWGAFSSHLHSTKWERKCAYACK